jgi:acylphosphatase
MLEQSAARAHVWVSGRVQGVFFRQQAARTARDLGLCGWVRNLPDGRVEAVFEGPRSAVQAAVEWTATGPAHAHVESREVEWEEPQGDGYFRVRG